MAEVCYLQIYVEKDPSQIYSMQNIVSPSARHSHASGLLLQLSGRSHGADQQSRWGLSTPPKLRFHMRIVHIMLHLQGKWDEKTGIMVCMNICIWYTICVSWYVSFLWEHQESIVEKLKSNSCKKRWRHTVKISWLLGCVVQCWSKWGSMKPNVHQNISTRICRTRLCYSLFSCGSCECWQMLPLLDPFSIRLAAPCDAIFTMAGWQSRKSSVWEGSMMFHDVPWSGSRTVAFCLCGGCCNRYHVILRWFSVHKPYRVPSVLASPRPWLSVPPAGVVWSFQSYLTISRSPNDRNRNSRCSKLSFHWKIESFDRNLDKARIEQGYLWYFESFENWCKLLRAATLLHPARQEAVTPDVAEAKMQSLNRNRRNRGSQDLASSMRHLCLSQ